MPYMKQHKMQVGISVGLSFILAAIQGAQVKLIRPLFDHGLNPEGSFEDTVKIAAVLFVLALLQLPTRFFHFYLMRYAIDSTLCAIRNDIFKKMQHLPTEFYTANKQGVLTSHMLSDATLYSDGIRGVVDLVREPLKALAMITLAVMADWQLTCVILLMTPLFLLILEYSGKKMRVNQGEVQEKTALLTHQVTEGISGHKTIKAFNLKSYTWNRFHSAQKKLFATITERNLHQRNSKPYRRMYRGLELFLCHCLCPLQNCFRGHHNRRFYKFHCGLGLVDGSHKKVFHGQCHTQSGPCRRP